MLTLTLITPDASALDLAGFRPDAFVDRSLEDVKRYPLWSNGQQRPAGELLRIEGDPTAGHWRFEGDLSQVHRLGEEMLSGVIEVAGSVGDQLGMQMRGGQILVEGDTGNEVGVEMRRGLIAVRGSVGELAGYRMRAGTLLVMGQAGRRPGAEMIRGTIGLFSDSSPTLLPTFRYACDFQPSWLPMLAQQTGLELPKSVSLHSGDWLNGGRGEVLTCSTSDET